MSNGRRIGPRIVAIFNDQQTGISLSKTLPGQYEKTHNPGILDV